MLRLKYYYLNKNEKKELKNDFYKTEFGKNINNRLNRLFLTGVIGILFSLFLIIKPTNKWDIVTSIILLVSSLLFIIGSFRVRIKKLNNFLINKNNK